MARGEHIPFDIIRMIIIRVISPSVESLDDWAECISALAVSRLWRIIGEPLLYANIVINIEAFSTFTFTFHSNADLVVSNKLENHVRAAVVHISPDLGRADAITAFYWHMSIYLTNSLKSRSTMDRIWSLVGAPTYLLSGACIEPLLLAMPNLRYLFIESRFMNEPWMQNWSMFLHYSVARQSSFGRDISMFTEFDFVTAFRDENIPAINTQTAMARMVLEPSSRKQTPSSKSCRCLVPSDDRVLFCAEYIRRLRILDLPERALSLDTAIDVMRDRNPCLPKEYYMHSPCYNIRYRLYLCVPNIWFENSTNSVTRYELFAFSRSANDHMLKIDNSIPDLISNYSDSDSDSDSAYKL